MPKRILIAGAGGFVGSQIALSLLDQHENLQIVAIDNLSRSGAAANVARLRQAGIDFRHSDVRMPSDLEAISRCEWIIDAAAHPSVLAGTSGHSSSRQVVENNLHGTLNLLELCRRWDAGFVFLSSSRVYSISQLARLSVTVAEDRYVHDGDGTIPGVSAAGIREDFSQAAPLSFYGATKAASETLALEYGETFEFPIWINRCGILAGATQFGRPDQGIFTFWLHRWREKQPLKYIGFGGHGYQVRDCLHPRDVANLISKQMSAGRDRTKPTVVNVSGGIDSARSLLQVSRWCRERWGPHVVAADESERRFDLPWLVLDAELAQRTWQWKPTRSTEEILREIAEHAEQNPGWDELSNQY